MNRNHKKRLDRYYQVLAGLEKSFIGYPCDAEFDYSALYRFLEFPINNVGDPFEHSTYRLETKEFEQDVLSFFAKLLHLKDHWGYITNGGTESNLYGLYAARETFPKATVFFSEHTHYSVKKNVHVLAMRYCVVKSDKTGEMDYEDFEKKISKAKEAIVVANIGTTMTGAIDNVDKITKILEKHKTKYHIHADAALYGMILPFVSDLRFDFRTKINSIAISGHKFIGSPIPCGILLARKKAVQNLRSYIQYIGAHDSTLSGSRDAFTPLLLWYRIKTIGIPGFKKQAMHCDRMAEFLVQKLQKIGWPDVRRSFLTVCFRKPSDKMISKWELAVNGDIAHVICMQHVDEKLLNRFVSELEAECGL